MISQLMTQLKNMMRLKKYRQEKVMLCTTGCLLDFAYFEKKYIDSFQLI